MKLFQKILIGLTCVAGLLGHQAWASSDTQADSLIFDQYTKQIGVSQQLPINELMVKTALYFLDKPYVGGTLEKNTNEQLVVNLRELDCTTFVESCMALSETMKSADKSFAHFKAILQRSRYRHGIINGYSSRLHYASDWIFDNEAKGFWKNITLKIGGFREEKRINFMSSHYQLYPAIKEDSLMRNKIEKCEDTLNLRNCYTILPKEKIVDYVKELKDGDIVFFGTKTEGLDFSHVAILYHHKGILTFIHASSAGKRVMIQPTSLVDYCQKSKNCNGIAVVRLHQ